MPINKRQLPDLGPAADEAKRVRKIAKVARTLLKRPGARELAIKRLHEGSSTIVDLASTSGRNAPPEVARSDVMNGTIVEPPLTNPEAWEIIAALNDAWLLLRHERKSRHLVSEWPDGMVCPSGLGDERPVGYMLSLFDATRRLAAPPPGWANRLEAALAVAARDFSNAKPPTLKPLSAPSEESPKKRRVDCNDLRRRYELARCHEAYCQTKQKDRTSARVLINGEFINSVKQWAEEHDLKCILHSPTDRKDRPLEGTPTIKDVKRDLKAIKQYMRDNNLGSLDALNAHIGELEQRRNV